MQKKTLGFFVLAFLVQFALFGASRPALAQPEKAPYPAMAPVSEYLISDQNSEIALARTAAPATISDAAEVMVLVPKGWPEQRCAPMRFQNSGRKSNTR